MERTVAYNALKGGKTYKTSCLEHRVEATEKLLRETVECLSRHHPKHSLGTMAYDSLEELRPRLEEGLDALANIEQSRGLTDQECSWQRAFRIVLSSRT